MRKCRNLSVRHALAAIAALALALGGAPATADGISVATLRATLGGPVVGDVVVKAQRRSDAGDYKLGPTDKIRVTVYDEPDLSGVFEIDSAGFVRLPLIGQIQAAGLTALELEGQIEDALDAGYLRDARVSVEVSQYRPFYIIGQVNKPGEYSYVSNMTVINAIALAGGYTDKAVQSVIYIRHEGDTTEHAVNVNQLTRIQPGDVVRVPETAFWSAIDVFSPISEVLAPITALAYVVKP